MPDLFSGCLAEWGSSRGEVRRNHTAHTRNPHPQADKQTQTQCNSSSANFDFGQVVEVIGRTRIGQSGVSSRFPCSRQHWHWSSGRLGPLCNQMTLEARLCSCVHVQSHCFGAHEVCSFGACNCDGFTCHHRGQPKCSTSQKNCGDAAPARACPLGTSKSQTTSFATGVKLGCRARRVRLHGFPRPREFVSWEHASVAG